MRCQVLQHYLHAVWASRGPHLSAVLLEDIQEQMRELEADETWGEARCVQDETTRTRVQLCFAAAMSIIRRELRACDLDMTEWVGGAPLSLPIIKQGAASLRVLKQQLSVEEAEYDMGDAQMHRTEQQVRMHTRRHLREQLLVAEELFLHVGDYTSGADAAGKVGQDLCAFLCAGQVSMDELMAWARKIHMCRVEESYQEGWPRRLGT